MGLAAYLLGIETVTQMERDPLRGNLFENMVIAELVKKRFNRGLDHNLFFYRDSNGNEVDILFKQANLFFPAEVKAASTFNRDFLRSLLHVRKQRVPLGNDSYIIYSGIQEMKVEGVQLLNFKKCGKVIPVSR